MPPYRDDRAGPRVTPGLPRLRCARRPDALSREAKRPPACRRPFGAARSRRRSGAAEGEAVAAVNGLAARGAEGDRCLLAAVGAGRGEHLARAAGIPATTAAAVATAAVAVAGLAATVAETGAAAVAATGVAAGRLAACAAGRATARLREAAGCVELLLTGCEDEVLAAIRTGHRLVAVQRKPLLCARRRPRPLTDCLAGVREWERSCLPEILCRLAGLRVHVSPFATRGEEGGACGAGLTRWVAWRCHGRHRQDRAQVVHSGRARF